MGLGLLPIGSTSFRGTLSSCSWHRCLVAKSACVHNLGCGRPVCKNFSADSCRGSDVILSARRRVEHTVLCLVLSTMGIIPFAPINVVPNRKSGFAALCTTEQFIVTEWDVFILEFPCSLIVMTKVIPAMDAIYGCAAPCEKVVSLRSSASSSEKV